MICETEIIDQLCVSIRRFGQLEPIEIWFAGEHFRILDGEKRYRACKKIGMEKIRAVIEKSEAF
jgi:ParB family chromosome partitioning protein